MDPLELDHLGFACRNLDALLAIFRRLGFAPTPPQALHALDASGGSRPLGQSSAHLVFRQTYVELSAVPDPAAGNHLEPFLARYEGLHIVALRTAGLEACHREFARHGLAPTAPASAGRLIEYGERHGQARFRWFMLPPERTPEGLVCVVRNESPELVYQPAVQRHPNGALDLAGLTLCAPDPEACAQRWSALLGPARVCGAGDLQFTLGNARLRLVTPERLRGELPAFRPPALPCVAGLELRVPSLEPLRERMRQAGWPHAEPQAATLHVALPGPAHALVSFRAGGA